MKDYNSYAQAPGRTAGIAFAPALKNVLTGCLGIALFIGLTFLGSLIRIPIQPVPITLQTMFVLLAGAVLGGKRGSIAQCSYVALGIAGIPLFSGSAFGPAALIGPTGGYIAAFIVTPLIVGGLIRKSHAIGWQLLVFSLGAMFILALGALHLALFYTHSLSAALAAGVLPFIPGDMLKVAAATSIFRSYGALARHRSRRV